MGNDMSVEKIKGLSVNRGLKQDSVKEAMLDIDVSGSSYRPSEPLVKTDAIPEWEFDEKKYPKYLFDHKAEQNTLIVEDGETLGTVGARFEWTKSQPFLDVLDFDLETRTSMDDQITTRKKRNANIAYSKLCRELLVDGFLEEIDEIGARTHSTLSKKEFIEQVPQELQAMLVVKWLDALKITRYYRKGESKLKQFMSSQTGSLFYKCELGQFLFLMEFRTPSKDARRAYEDNVVDTESKQEDKAIVNFTHIDNARKMRFAKEHFVNVQGISILEEGTDFDSRKPDHVSAFKSAMNAVWWVAFGDHLATAFDKAGK